MSENKVDNKIVSKEKKKSQSNIREYMMYIALVVIFAFFTWATDGVFIEAKNLSNLVNQAGYIAVLAIGMTLILILKHIDLSVGFVAGSCGAFAAILMTKQNFSALAAIVFVLLAGLLIGIVHGVLVTMFNIPAFVTTLASMFIFKGILALSLQETGTIIIPDDSFFNKISNDFIPDIANVEGIHVLTVIIGILAMVIMIFSQIKKRRTNIKYGFEISSTSSFIAKQIALCAVIGVITSVLASYKGIPWNAVIVGVVLFIFNFILNKTKLGRYIYGVGGNDQAAELSGVNVKRVTMFAFAAMSTLAALSGILFTSRFRSAAPTAGVGFEMDAIASSYIGGVAVSGGVGKVTNTIVGTLVIMSLTNGMNLMSIDISYQYVVKGIIFVLAVAFDVVSRSDTNIKIFNFKKSAKSK